MKKLFSFTALFSAFLFLIFLLAQCKPSGGETSDAATTTEEAAPSEDTVAPQETMEETTSPSEAEPMKEETPAPTPESTEKARPEAATTTPATRENQPKAEAPKESAAAEPAPQPAPKPTATDTEEPAATPPPKETNAAKEPQPKAPATAATPVVSNFSVKSSKGVVGGTSSLHDWEMEITEITCKGAFQTLEGTITEVRNVELKVPVESLKSEEGKIMDNKTYKAFDSGKNPYIVYTFNSAEVKSDASGNVSIPANGTLNMAGKSRSVSITAKGKILPNGDLQLSVSRKLDMTEFGMEPPTALMGAIKVGPEVTVNFDLVLSR